MVPREPASAMQRAVTADENAKAGPAARPLLLPAPAAGERRPGVSGAQACPGSQDGFFSVAEGVPCWDEDGSVHAQSPPAEMHPLKEGISGIAQTCFSKTCFSQTWAFLSLIMQEQPGEAFSDSLDRAIAGNSPDAVRHHSCVWRRCLSEGPGPHAPEIGRPPPVVKGWFNKIRTCDGAAGAGRPCGP